MKPCNYHDADSVCSSAVDGSVHKPKLQPETAEIRSEISSERSE